MDKDILKLSPIKGTDLYVLMNQIRRIPRGVIGVAKRCRYGYPQVIATNPILKDRIFPTLFWLTCPSLIEELSVLENKGWVRHLDERLRDDPVFAKKVMDAHEEYANMRARFLSKETIESLRNRNPRKAIVVEESGIGGSVRFDGTKCLHMHIADHLGRGANPVAELLKETFPGLLEPDSICNKYCSRWDEDFQRYGAIDVGTNSIRLLIADLFGDGAFLVPILHKIRIARFGEGVSTTGFINENAARRSLNVFYEYSKDLKDYKVEHVKVVATSAARDGINSMEVLSNIASESGLPTPRIISGQEEALLTYNGAVKDVGFLPSYSERKDHLRKAVVVDVGGGSTEFISKSGKESVKSFSLNIGAVRLSECFIANDPIDDTEYSRLISHIRHEIEIIAQKFIDVSLLIGVGGTATSLATISQALEEYEKERVHGYQLTQSQIAEILEHLKALPLTDRRRVKGLQPERADVILAGIAIFLVAMECFKVDKLLVSDSDILQGIIYSSAFTR